MLLQVVIKRTDTGQWAIPGGLVHEEEVTTDTLRRAFASTAMGLNDEKELKELRHQLDGLFANSGGWEIYRG